jgi:hypothetical protein
MAAATRPLSSFELAHGLTLRLAPATVLKSLRAGFVILKEPPKVLMAKSTHPAATGWFGQRESIRLE